MTRPRASCVRFALDGQSFGLPLDQVREITAVQRVHPVPFAPPHILGLINLRGQVVTLLDVAAILGRPFSQEAAAGMALVLSAPRENLALRVPAPVQIGEARPVAVASMAAAGASDDGTAAAHDMVGMASQDLGPDDLVEMLSAPDLIARVEERLLAGFRTGVAP
ncbi:MAG: chemotaxis protein CheW [Candidatus Polarisedimenticolia bacterium]